VAVSTLDGPAVPLTTTEPLSVTEPPPVNPHAALQLAMRIGDALLAAGMSANDVVLFVLRVTEAYGLAGVHVDVTYTAMTASYYPSPGAPPITSVRVVRPAIVDYTRVRRLDRLVGRIGRGLSLAEAAQALEEIRSAPPPYPRWISMVGNAGLATAVSLLFSTDWKILLLAFLTGCVVDLMIGWSDRRRVPPFFRNFMAAAFVTLVAAGITYAGNAGVSFFVGVDTTLLVVGGIVMLLAGMMVVGAVQDAIDQFYVTAAARIFEVFMRTAGIVAGIVAALALAKYLGVVLTISAEPLALGPLWAQFVAVGLIAAMFSVSVYSDAVTIVLATTMALISWTGYLSALRLELAVVPANAAAALVSATLTTLIVRRTHVPGFGLVTASLLPLVPGLALYRGLLQLIGTEPATADPAAGGATLLLALGVAVGIGAGASLGISFGRPIADQVRRITFRSRRRARAADTVGP
jgi:uncharacterized membrane protein YjjP (DUF1212 family)